MERLNYQNKKEGFALTFPKSWMLYRTFDKSLLIDGNLDVKYVAFGLPSRSVNWHSNDAPAGLAVLFRIFIFPKSRWEYYKENYVNRERSFRLTGRVLGERDGEVYFLGFSTDVPSDMFLYVKESEKVAETFRFLEK